MIDNLDSYRNHSREIDNIEEISDQDLCNSKPWKNKVWHYYGLAEYNKAQKYFDKATQLDSRDMNAWKGRSSNCPIFRISFCLLTYYCISSNMLT